MRDTKRPFKKMYDPYHPAADNQGYITLPNVCQDVERSDVRESKNSYEVNLKLIKVLHDMINNTITLVK